LEQLDQTTVSELQSGGYFRKNSIIEVHSEYFHLPVTQLWRTYEMWVLLKVCEAIRKIGFQLKKQRLVNIDTGYIYDAKKIRFDFDLAKNKPLLELHKEDRTIKLYYRREYQTGFDHYGSVDEKAQIPDVAIEIFGGGEIVPDVVIVEVKYRIKEDKPPESAKKELSHYVKMIRNKQGKRLVKNAYIAYPGTLTRSTKRGDYGYIGLTPNSDMKRFEQKILEMVGQQ
jgi:hypothetical protein